MGDLVGIAATQGAIPHEDKQSANIRFFYVCVCVCMYVYMSVSDE